MSRTAPESIASCPVRFGIVAAPDTARMVPAVSGGIWQEYPLAWGPRRFIILVEDVRTMGGPETPSTPVVARPRPYWTTLVGQELRDTFLN